MSQNWKKLKRLRVKHNLRKFFLYVRFKRIRLLMRESKLKGECIGWERAIRSMLSKERTIIAGHSRDVKDINSRNQNKITLLEAEHWKEIEELRRKHLIDKNYLIDSHRKEIKEYDKQFEVRCKRNDAIRIDAINQADEAKYKSQQAEDYWNKQAIKINDFIAQATGVVGVVSGRFKDAQLRMAEMSTGEDMMKNLSKTLENISKNAHNHSPKMVNT